ncbi:CLPS isoform 2 [Pan troglodytes]|uniref:Colipase n=6 Tax=Homininae TaxID=207598 RepID=A0A087X0Q7_HUMAN|nr:colipase isoform 3 preproprotein [Homo sapiens]EAX03851.1 colipase, pancreatic, isoform CRA_b [Homo sapiens]KAI2542060.1 colipase [Homo sapiens]KAI4018035.1 colipase [Homo sapiens]PNI77016.1 CLPS isoform 2 [Pan troglodytes]|eukprot:NP_001239527.1 colipase isoform 3 preproprotein [Homo sapiens]
MEKILILLLVALSVAYAAPGPRGIIINLTLYGIYYKCPCERGLTCEGDKTIVGSITNTNFGICHDAGRSKQ